MFSTAKVGPLRVVYLGGPLLLVVCLNNFGGNMRPIHIIAFIQIVSLMTYAGALACIVAFLAH
jgi:hypothetical protein